MEEGVKKYIFIVFLVIFTIFFGISSNETYETKVDVKYDSTRQMGDMNGDGKITAADVALLYRYVRGNKTVIDSEAIKVADLSGDGKITVSDVSLLYRKLRSITNDDSSKDDNKDDNKKDDTSTLNCSSTPKSFETDSWDTIICAAKSGNTSAYRIGDEREIDMGSFGKHKVRLANKSTVSYCKNENYSNSYCGFVIEFTDIVTKHVFYDRINSLKAYEEGWSVSSMRTYVNNEIYNAIPSKIRQNIIDTRIVSNYSTNIDVNDPECSWDNINFDGPGISDCITSGIAYSVTTYDKIYLLSSTWDFSYQNPDRVTKRTTAEESTKKDEETVGLDFYKKYLGNKYQNYNVLVKKLPNEKYYRWWTRDGGVIERTEDGYKDDSYSDNRYGVSPVFRLGE